MSETTSENAVLRAALAAAEARAATAEHELTQSRAVISASDDMIRHLRLEDLETDIAADRAKAEAEAP